MDKEIIIKKYQKYQQPNPTKYHQYFFKTPSQTIHIYQNGKILIQGQAAREAKNNFQYSANPGSDECGKGDVFGSIFVVSALVLKSCPKEIIDQISDSKKIKDETIIELATKIKKYAKYAILQITPDQYNFLTQTQKTNLNLILAHAHLKAHDQLAKQIDFSSVIIDAFCSNSNWNKYVSSKEQLKFKVKLVEKAESSYLNVAAASIIARDCSIREFNQFSNQLGFQVKRGANQHVVDQIVKIDALKLKNYVKVSFNNVQTYLNNKNSKEKKSE